MCQNKVYTLISIADIHFGCNEDPKYMYEQLKLQFINKIDTINFQVVSICGDLFDSRMMSNNIAVTYAVQFISDLVEICIKHNASLLLLAGTQSHDAGQLSLFYHYMGNPAIDVRIIEKIQFEEVQGLRFLCIPELYGVNKDVYEHVLYNSGRYDICILHGSYRNSFKGTEIASLDSNGAPIFGNNHFINNAGPTIMGHYHIPGSYDSYSYYCGSAFRYKFGEEQDKGFLVTLFNPYTRMQYTELVPIISKIYATININHLINDNPENIIKWIKEQKIALNADYIRVQFNNAGENMNVVRNYFRNNGMYKLQELDRKDKQIQQIDQTVIEQNQQYSYIIDPSIGDYDKFIMYVNQNEGYDFISADELIKLLEDNI